MTSQAVSTEELVSARLMELVDARAPWHRSLWQAGSILTLQEILEYADGTRSGATRPEGLSYVTHAACQQVKRDRGLGAEPTREAILSILSLGTDKTRGVLQKHVSDSLGQLTRRAEIGYLRRWANAVRDGLVGPEDAELLARLVASHLLDAGFASDHIHGWLMAHQATPLASLLDLGDEMCREEAATFNVLVPFTSLPRVVADAAGDRFRSAEDTETMLETRGATKPPGRRGAGSLTFSVRAREPWSAVAATEIDIRRLAARVVVGLSAEQVQPSGHALVLDTIHSRWRPLRSRQKKDILVSAIARHGLLLPAARSDTNHDIDDALELLAAVETSTSWASVAAIWAAVEGLLARAGDKGADAADRMAAVVASNFVRAELVDLATRLQGLQGPVSEALSVESVPFAARLDALYGSICAEADLPELKAVDAAAVARLQAISKAPHETLDRIEGYLASAFRRLFQQRNLLLHGGRFDSVALPLTMRTVPLLVAAGLDRLVYAVMGSESIAPLELAARARNELDLAGGLGARPLHRLLD